MNLSAVSHRSLFADCYARNQKEVTLNIHTGKDITAVNLLFDDPYAYGISGNIHRVGKPLPMHRTRELKYPDIYSVTLTPEEAGAKGRMTRKKISPSLPGRCWPTSTHTEC